MPVPSRMGSAAGARPLASGWQILPTAPGAYADASSLPEDGWSAPADCGTVAHLLRTLDRFSLDAADAIDFDGQDWWYRLRFDVDDGEKMLGFDGLATLCEAWLNGTFLLRSENMFLAHRCETEALRPGDNELLLCFRSVEAALAQRRPRPHWRVPMLEQQQLRWIRTTLLGRTPGWSPPVPPVGPWRPVWIAHGKSPVPDARLHASLDGDDGLLAVSCTVADAAATAVRIEIAGPTGVRFASLVREAGTDRWSAVLRVPGVERWWPHTHGAPARYDAVLHVENGSRGSVHPLGRVGFRSAEIADPQAFRIRINGSDVFCRGACWTPSDIVSLRHAPDDLRGTLTLLRDAGMNMLRVCGPMVYEEPLFYELCDELGVMVWQDLMLANMDYPFEDEAFRLGLEKEIAQQCAVWRSRPCLTIVCGNSEAAQQACMWGAHRSRWSHAFYEERLPALLHDELPGVACWPSSAWGGALPQQVDTGTTSYYGVGAYMRPLDDARGSGLRFATECLAFANVPPADTLRRIPGRGIQRATQAGWKQRSPRDLTAGWDFDDVRDHYAALLFGVDAARMRYLDHDHYLAVSRLTTAEAMIGAFSHWRRSGSSCGGALVWFLRDLWAGAGWGMLDDTGKPKACFYALRRVLQPRALLLTDEGNNGLYAHVINEGVQALHGRLVLRAWRDAAVVIRGECDVSVDGRATQRVVLTSIFDHFVDLTHAFRFGPPAHDVVAVTWLDANGVQVASAFHFPHGLGLPRSNDIGLDARARAESDGTMRVRVQAARLAVGVHFDTPGYLPEDDHFHLAPGDVRDVLLRPVRVGGPWCGTVACLNGTSPVAIANDD